jgi:ABC-2 type transport system ATP-binding protein
MTDTSSRTAATDHEHSVAVEDLRLSYSDGTEAVGGVSLAIPRGEFFGFLGPNGAGKTTTIKVLATLLNPTDGTVRVNGYDVTEHRTAVRATVGYMAQETAIDEELTARENLDFACSAYGVPRDERDERIAELLDLVDLADVADRPAGGFSGGMKKRLDAATALVHEPQLVFLDEPTTGLDPKARNRLWDYFRAINDAGTTVFLTTQYLEEADALCDRLAVIRDGEVVERGSPAALKRRIGGEILEVDVDDGAVERATEIARAGGHFDDGATVEPTDEGVRVTTRRASEHGTDFVVALREAGVAVERFDVEEPSLDDVFLAVADGDAPDLDAADDEPANDSRDPVESEGATA